MPNYHSACCAGKELSWKVLEAGRTVGNPCIGTEREDGSRGGGEKCIGSEMAYGPRQGSPRRKNVWGLDSVATVAGSAPTCLRSLFPTSSILSPLVPQEKYPKQLMALGDAVKQCGGSSPPHMHL